MEKIDKIKDISSGMLNKGLDLTRKKSKKDNTSDEIDSRWNEAGALFKKDALLLKLIYENRCGKFINPDNNIAINYSIEVMKLLKSKKYVNQYKVFKNCCSIFGYGDDFTSYRADYYHCLIEFSNDDKYRVINVIYIMNKLFEFDSSISSNNEVVNLLSKVIFNPNEPTGILELLLGNSDDEDIEDFEDLVLKFHKYTDPSECLDKQDYSDNKAKYDEIIERINYHEIDYILEKIQKSKGISLK